MEENKSRIVRGYRQDAQSLHRLLRTASRADLRRSSIGTGWSNEQLLFHMVFGYMVVRALIPLVHVLVRCPAGVQSGFSRLLNATTPLFHPVNYAGSCAAALVFNHRRMARRQWLTINARERKLERESPAALLRRADFPERWDPFFSRSMTLSEIYAYPSRHFAFHARQLSLRP
ncbi:DinB family protein [Glutamicibacter sp. AOP3-A1-12]|uniref:DinB family protein n=1 Tax=Glutamicibacter sp. AOP3-A1-12 TaxID=3457701 RepID=UPI004034E627